MDFHQIEQEAFGLYEEGEFTAAKHLFEKLEQTDGPSKEVHSFNKTCCVAAEGETAQALGDLLANYETLPSHSDPISLYNMALCLLNLDRPDLTLAILAKIDREDDNQDDSTATITQTKVGFDHLAHLFMHCVQKLNDLTSISKTQCNIIERLLHKYKGEILEYTDESVWQRNLAHILFLMDTRYERCVRMLEDLLPDDGMILHDETDPVVLGNLCQSYILTNRIQDAEDLLKEIEHGESLDGAPSSMSSPAGSAPIQVNLAIGTMYCVKNNYEFGLTRIFKTLEPLSERLTGRAWTQVKRCILSGLDKHCKQMIHIQDELFDRMIGFLIECETHGLEPTAGEGKNSIACEARHLRSILLTIVHD